MIDLVKYFEADELNWAWLMNDQLYYTYDDDHGLVIFGKNLASKIASCDTLSELDKKIVLSWTKSLGEFMHQGPVIVRPGLVLSKALLDTQLNFSIMDYRQPFKAMAVEIPDEILGPYGPNALAFVYQPFHGELILSLRSEIGGRRTTYNVHIGNDMPTIEERASQMEWADTPEEGEFFHGICRIAINACLLAATRQTKTESLPEKIAKKRAKRDPKLNQLAARHCQEITFRDLIVYDRVKTDSKGEATGMTFGPQQRRGHWKKVVYGPKLSLYRLQWIHSYWTHRNLKFGVEQQTIIMK